MNTTLSILLMAIGSILCAYSWIFSQDVHNVPVSSLWQENEGKAIRAFIKKGSTAVIARNLSYKGYVWAKW